jgi:hypothetical protein
MPTLGEIASFAADAKRMAEELAQAPAGVPFDFQFGTWTPADNSGAALAIAVDSAFWYRFAGRFVVAQMRIDYPATASGAAASIKGLPFPLSTGDANRQGFVTLHSAAFSPLYVVPVATGSSFNFNTTSSVAVTNSQLSGAAVLATIVYGCKV